MSSQQEISDRDKKIIDKYLNNVSICKIASEYGISRQRVFQIVSNNKKHRDKLCIVKIKTKENILKIKEMRNNGLSWKEIANHLDISDPSNIKKYLNKKEYSRYGCNENEKRCPHCKEIKQKNEFSWVKSTNTLAGFCKECVAKVHRERKYWRTNEN